MKDDVIVLLTNDGEEIEFVEVAGINLEGNFYIIMQPVVLLDGMRDDEAFVFLRTYENDNEQYSLELDDEIIDRVFEKYYRMLDEKSNQ